MFFVVPIAIKGLGSSGGVIVVIETENSASGIGNVGDGVGKSLGDSHNRRP